MPRGIPDIQNYSPELFEIFAKASQEEVLIECGPRRLATRLRHRLYSLRVAMSATHHELEQAAKQVSISMYEDSEGSWWLKAYPGDSDDLIGAIRAAGITVGSADAETDDTASDESLDKFLGNMTGDKGGTP